jgi:predicted DNA binding CopG/RHH family protein
VESNELVEGEEVLSKGEHMAETTSSRSLRRVKKRVSRHGLEIWMEMQMLIDVLLRGFRVLFDSVVLWTQFEFKERT